MHKTGDALIPCNIRQQVIVIQQLTVCITRVPYGGHEKEQHGGIKVKVSCLFFGLCCVRVIYMEEESEREKGGLKELLLVAERVLWRSASSSLL